MGSSSFQRIPGGRLYKLKAKPVIFENMEWVQVEPSKATHIALHIPGRTGIMHLPIIIKVTREGTGKWTWNGDTEKPTIKPSVLTTSGHFADGFKQGDSCWCTYYAANPDDAPTFKCYRCHTWINDGKAQFLDDCSHELVGQTLDLLDVK